MKFMIVSLVLVASSASFARSIECAPQGSSASASRKVIQFQNADDALVFEAEGKSVRHVSGNKEAYKCSTTVDGLGEILSVSCNRSSDETEVNLYRTSTRTYIMNISQFNTVHSDTGVRDKNLVSQSISQDLNCSVR